MDITRRNFIKAGLAAATAASMGLPLSDAAWAEANQFGKQWRWDKGVCRFCGVGCGIKIATHNNRIVATMADPDAPVNRGLNCIKGYFLSKILYNVHHD